MEVSAQFAAKEYSALRPATQAGQDAAQGAFAQVMQGVNALANTLHTSEHLSKQAMTGSVDPHELVTALTQSQLAVDTAVAVRNKVVEAYQEILRMPV